MRNIILLFSLLLGLSIPLFAQTSWMLEETIDQSDVWNRSFYSAYNSADKLISNQTDSGVYCKDCNLSVLIWKGIESNKIAAYQIDKSAALVVQKSVQLKKKLHSFLVAEPNRMMTEVLHTADISVYRRAVSNNPIHIKGLTIEWLSITISISDKSFTVYVKAKDSFTYLKMNACYWVHPFNLNTKAHFADALIQRNYIAKNYKVVAAYNLQANTTFTFSNTTVARQLVQTDQLTEKSVLYSSDTLLVYMQAICRADIRSKENRGYSKVHLPELLLKLYSDKKVKGYEYHEAGYFTPMTQKKLSAHFIVETEEDGSYTATRMNTSDLTQLSVFKTETKTASETRVRNEWLLLGMGTDVSAAFANQYVIAFPFEETLIALSAEKQYWFNGLNESDSLQLSEALLTQRIAYDEMRIQTVYGDTILMSKNKVEYSETRSSNTLADLYYGQCSALIVDFDAMHKRIVRPAKMAIESFKLRYWFDALPNNTAIVEGVLEGIESNKIQAYKDADLKESAGAAEIIYLLDKARFYKTGNAKKDSIYISKISANERYINTADLTESMLTTLYKTVNGKSTNTAISFGIFIPAEIHPQYEQETLCYVSYAAMLKYLGSAKATKKYVKQLKELAAQKTIVEVVDFYDILRYNALDPEALVPDDLPAFVRERVKR